MGCTSSKDASDYGNSMQLPVGYPGAQAESQEMQKPKGIFGPRPMPEDGEPQPEPSNEPSVGTRLAGPRTMPKAVPRIPRYPPAPTELGVDQTLADIKQTSPRTPSPRLHEYISHDAMMLRLNQSDSSLEVETPSRDAKGKKRVDSEQASGSSLPLGHRAAAGIAPRSSNDDNNIVSPEPPLNSELPTTPASEQYRSAMRSTPNNPTKRGKSPVRPRSQEAPGVSGAMVKVPVKLSPRKDQGKPAGADSPAVTSRGRISGAILTPKIGQERSSRSGTTGASPFPITPTGNEMVVYTKGTPTGSSTPTLKKGKETAAYNLETSTGTSTLSHTAVGGPRQPPNSRTRRDSRPQSSGDPSGLRTPQKRIETETEGSPMRGRSASPSKPDTAGSPQKPRRKIYIPQENIKYVSKPSASTAATPAGPHGTRRVYRIPPEDVVYRKSEREAPGKRTGPQASDR